MVYLGKNLVFIYCEVLLHNLVVHVITALAKVSVPSLFLNWKSQDLKALNCHNISSATFFTTGF